MSLAWLGWEFEPEVSNTSAVTCNVEVFQDKEFTFGYEWLRREGLPGIAYRAWQCIEYQDRSLCLFKKNLPSSTAVGYSIERQFWPRGLKFERIHGFPVGDVEASN